MRAVTVKMSDLARRGSWLPTDFLYERGDHVRIAGETVVVVRQEGDDVWVADVENVPGSSTPFACSTPRRVSLYDIDLRKQR